GVASKLLRRILHWTGGHPYLTQRLSLAVAEDASVTKAAGVDRLCKELFFSSRAREQDHNLMFVRERILRSEEDRVALLDLYQQVHRGRKVQDDDANSLMSILRLAGLVRVATNYLQVRNRIYVRVFDKEWINANMPDAELRRQRAAYWRGVLRTGIISALVIFSLCAGGYWYMDGYILDHVRYYNTYAKRFGVMVGVGELTGEQVRRRQVSYRFTQKGRRTEAVDAVYKVEAVNSSGKLTSKHNVREYLPDDSKYSDIEQECRWKFVRDADANLVYEQAYNKADKFVWGLVYSPRVKGEPVHAHYVGPDGFPRSRQKTAAEFVEFDYSAQGDERVILYFDRHHRPKSGPDGYHRSVNKYDDRGNRIEWMFFDEQGKPTLHQDGFHKSTTRYDERGKQIEWAFFDKQGKPTLHQDGFHKSTTRYDERGNRIEWAYFDEQGKPTLHQDGSHKSTTKYDERGNQIEWVCFDEQGKPTLHQDGSHKSTTKYDERGNQIEWAYFDEQGKPALHKNGFHKSTTKHDDRGNRIEWAFFDKQGKPTLHQDGYHKMICQYDAQGNQINKVYYDKKGQPMPDFQPPEPKKEE
ncbi:MAG: hypothetical protein D3924_15320, partial [Candidatus Electrothrix sp. AR4]|nr:hypothetical protein [Candidatus Electrothrix sp. AR4]